MMSDGGNCNNGALDKDPQHEKQSQSRYLMLERGILRLKFAARVALIC